MKQSTAASPVSFLSDRNVIGNRVRSSAFTWCPLTRSFVGEASGLREELFQSLYRNAAGHGFVLVSEVTGSEALFSLVGTEQSAGEIAAWVFCPTAESVRRTPALRGVRVVCLND